MRKLFLLVVTSLSLGTISCSSDDNNSKNLTPEGYPQEIHRVDLKGKEVGDEVVLTGKGFEEQKISEYKITFTKKRPDPKTSNGISARAPKPEESDSSVEAVILHITDTTLRFAVPTDAGNGSVNFIYKDYTTPIGNYQR